MERILNLGMECIGQFVGEPPVRGPIDEALDGPDKGAVTGRRRRSGRILVERSSARDEYSWTSSRGV